MACQDGRWGANTGCHSAPTALDVTRPHAVTRAAGRGSGCVGSGWRWLAVAFSPLAVNARLPPHSRDITNHSRRPRIRFTSRLPTSSRLSPSPPWSQSAIPPPSSAMSSTRRCRPSWTHCSTRKTPSPPPPPPPLQPLSSFKSRRHRLIYPLTYNRDRDVSEAFHDLLPKRQFADYYKLIKHPQALNPVQVGTEVD